MNDGPVHILLVEDELAHAELVRRAFEARRQIFQLSVAATLTEARARVTRGAPAPALIITDWRLPDGDGLELLLAERGGRRIPVVIMTSHGNEQIAVEALKLGALDYVVKSDAALADMPHTAERALREWDHLTARAEMEEALRRSEEKYRGLVEEINDIIYLADERGVVVYISPVVEQESGYRVSEVVGRPFVEFVHPDDLPIILERFQRLLAGHEEPFEYRFRTKFGAVRWMRSSSRLVLEGGRVVGVRGVLTDVTGRRQAEEELRALNAQLEQRIAERTVELVAANARLKELDELKSKFVSDVSHELRTPVTALRLQLDMLERGSVERRAHYLSMLRQQTDLLTRLIEDILDLSRLERDKAEAQFAPVDLNALAEQVVSAQQPRAAAAGLRLAFEPEARLPPALGAANQLQQVITNLVANAVNYTRTGWVRVRTRLDGAQVCLEVQDTGLGIDPEDLPNLFERFYRGKQAAQSGIPGTGLGLGIVKEIVDLHRGTIDVQSRVGQGSTFRVWLPAAPPGRVWEPPA
jgi:hypothetical protein